MDNLISPFKNGKLLNVIFFSNVLLAFHYYLIVYINSTFLNQYFSEAQVSTLYVIGSILNIFFFINISKLLNTIGNYRTVMYALVVEIIATVGLVVASSPFLISVYFITHVVTVAVIAFNLDVFLEGLIIDENKTGNIRSMYMTLGNIICAVSPLIVAIMLVNNVYWHIYAISAVFLLPMLYYFKKYFDTHETKPIEYINIRQTFKEYLANKDLFNIFAAQFMLQLFYAYMVIYTPIYLIKYVGFSWESIGILFTIMLLPFVLFEIPIGDLADKKYGEKEFLTVGFVIMGIFTMLISFLNTNNFLIWAVVLFATRIGASFVEVTADSYFFKHVNQEKTNLISFFRMTRPVSYIVAPVIVALSLQFIPFQYTFIIIGALMIVGTRYSLALVDTK